jgi:hypothetical protein
MLARLNDEELIIIPIPFIFFNLLTGNVFDQGSGHIYPEASRRDAGTATRPGATQAIAGD